MQQGRRLYTTASFLVRKFSMYNTRGKLYLLKLSSLIVHSLPTWRCYNISALQQPEAAQYVKYLKMFLFLDFNKRYMVANTYTLMELILATNFRLLMRLLWPDHCYSRVPWTTVTCCFWSVHAVRETWAFQFRCLWKSLSQVFCWLAVTVCTPMSACSL